MLPISVCIISKNEEKHIEECMKHLLPYSFEIILVDTGSTDNTVTLAKKYTDKIFHFDWCNDFSAARNFSIEKASNDWVLILDCDEYLMPLDEPVLAPLLIPERVGMIMQRNLHSNNTFGTVPIPRLFHKKFFLYHGLIHEQVVSISGAKFICQNVPITVDHYGYYDNTVLAEKSSRNQALLLKELETDDTNPYILYQLGKCCFSIKEYEKTCAYFEKAFTMDIDESLDYLLDMIEIYAICLIQQKRYREALDLEGVYDVCSRHADYLYLMGEIYLYNDMTKKAISMFELAIRTPYHDADGINSYRPNYKLGCIYEILGDIKRAKEYYTLCGSYSPATFRLKELCNIP